MVKSLYTQKWVFKTESLSLSLSLYTPVNISTSDQRCFKVVDQRLSDVENETKSDIRFSTLRNFDTTLYQHFFNIASTLVNAISNPVGLVMIMDLQMREIYEFWFSIATKKHHKINK